MCLVPIVGIGLAYLVFHKRYKLDEAFMKKVVAKITGAEPNEQPASEESESEKMALQKLQVQNSLS